MAKNDTDSATSQYPFLGPSDPVCLVIKAALKPVGAIDRFQPAGFPEIGHVIYDAPRTDQDGNRTREKVCIVDSPASMANHLETVCVAGAGSMDLHADLANLPYVVCKTEPAHIENGKVDVESKEANVVVATTFTEGHRLASDYFLDAKQGDQSFRDNLRKGFKIVEVKKDKTYFIPTNAWWNIYRTIFKYDPNSLVHGVLFAKEQIKISRLLTAHLEAFGASRVGRSGVKFDKLGKTTSGQPIFSVDEETAQEIRATFIIDLALLRSYGRDKSGLTGNQKKLLLDLALWKIKQLLARPFRYRTQCFLGCESVAVETELGILRDDVPADKDAEGSPLPSLLRNVAIHESIKACDFTGGSPAPVYYPAVELFKAGKDDGKPAGKNSNEPDDSTEED